MCNSILVVYTVSYDMIFTHARWNSPSLYIPQLYIKPLPPYLHIQKEKHTRKQHQNKEPWPIFGAAVFLFLPQNEIKEQIHRNRGGSVEVVEGIYFCNKEEMGEDGSLDERPSSLSFPIMRLPTRPAHE